MRATEGVVVRLQRRTLSLSTTAGALATELFFRGVVSAKTSGMEKQKQIPPPTRVSRKRALSQGASLKATSPGSRRFTASLRCGRLRLGRAVIPTVRLPRAGKNEDEVLRDGAGFPLGQTTRAFLRCLPI